MSSNETKSMQNPLAHQHWPFQATFQSTKVIWDPHGGFRPKKEEKIQNVDIFFKADPPANTSTVQKYGPGSNGAGQDMTWPQLSPKQLVSISHATSDLIRGPGRIQLSVFNPKPLNRHAYG